MEIVGRDFDPVGVFVTGQEFKEGVVGGVVYYLLGGVVEGYLVIY